MDIKFGYKTAATEFRDIEKSIKDITQCLHRPLRSTHYRRWNAITIISGKPLELPAQISTGERQSVV